jgi:hypothetical protein
MGGLVYNSWRGFATVKVKHSPAQPQTSKQLAVRAIAIMCARAWQLLAGQAAWNTYAATHLLVDWTNSPKRLTGANWYVMLSTRLMRMGVTPVVTPPIVAAPDPVADLTAVDAVGRINFTWSSPVTPGTLVHIWLDGPRSAGRIGSLARAKYADQFAGDAIAPFITGLQPGTYTAYALQISPTDGQVSLFVSADVAVT